MRYVRGLCFSFWALLACSVQADTIPTLTATSASRLSWYTANPTGGSVWGPDFFLRSYSTVASSGYPCSTPVPDGGCVAPGPALFLQEPQLYEAPSGGVTLDGIGYSVYFEGNAQIQYSTPTIVYPDPSTSNTANIVTVPVVLSGSERACLKPPDPTFSDPCLDYYRRPGYPNYLANISINIPGTLTIWAIQDPGGPSMGAYFDPVPEPGSVALACIGFVLLMGCRMHRRRTSL